jgi:hypothetical protein
MDTRFWGPSGWRLLHLITFTYDGSANAKASVKEMFSMLPYVLPCKFCRQSLSEYYEADPLEPALKSRETLSRWLWRIHNMVNAKLRGQGLLIGQEDPSFTSVKKVYMERIAAGCSRTDFEGWDFLFSIAENYPLRVSSGGPPPPAAAESQGHDMRNRLNTMGSAERMIFYTRFWKSIGDALPFAEWREVWGGCAPRFTKLGSKRRWMKELWRIRKCLENQLNLLNRDEYESLCKRLADHRSGCAKKVRARTCRREKRGDKRQARRTRTRRF